MDTDTRQVLTVDVEKYEETATPDSEDKVKALYGRIHKGLYVRLALPFLFFIGVKQLKMVMSDKEDDDFLDD
jgi:hypothetical protein